MAFTSRIIPTGLPSQQIARDYLDASPTVDFQIHASNELSLIGRHEKQGISNVRWFCQTPERHITNELCSVLRSIWNTSERFKAKVSRSAAATDQEVGTSEKLSNLQPGPT